MASLGVGSESDQPDDTEQKTINGESIQYTVLTRGSESFHALSEDGCVHVIPMEAVARSKCLQTLFDNTKEEVIMPLPYSWLQAWLAFVTGDYRLPRRMPVRQLLHILQARCVYKAISSTFIAPCIWYSALG